MDIPEYLAKADCFVCPSEYDVWGLVVVEAMAASVPCVSSIHAGVTDDLICDSRTGFAMEFSNAKSVADRIDWLLNHREEAHAIGFAGGSFIETCKAQDISKRDCRGGSIMSSGQMLRKQLRPCVSS